MPILKQLSAPYLLVSAQALKSREDFTLAEALAAIVMASAFSEAFINELGEVIVTHGNHMKGCLSPSFSALGETLSMMESEKCSLQTKYFLASHALGKLLDKGTQPYQDFNTLVRVRNEIVHYKGTEEFLIGDGVYKPTRQPSMLADLQKRKLATAGDRQPWIISIANQTMAQWAYETSLGMANAILDRMIPVSETDKEIFLLFTSNYRGTPTN